MADLRPTKLVSFVQRALAAGPVSQDELLTSLQRAGVRVDVGVLWETCRIHGIADLHDDVWVPRGWAPPANDRPSAATSPMPGPVPRVPVQRASGASPEHDTVGRRAAARVRRIADLLGLGTPEPVPPVGPVPTSWSEVASGARRALADELAAVTKRRTETDVPLMDGQDAGVAASRRLVRFEAQNEIGGAEGTRGLLIVQDLQFEVEVISVFGAAVTLSLPSDAPVTREATLRLDLSWLLNAQSRRLWELINGGPGFDAEAALAAVTSLNASERATSSIASPALEPLSAC